MNGYRFLPQARPLRTALARSALAGSALLAVLALTGCQRPVQPLAPGAALPPLVLDGLQGDRLESAQWRGRTVVLNLWATWCPPCREEMPALERLSRSLDPAHYRVVGVSLDTDRNLVREFALRHGITFALAIDPQGRRVKRALGTRVLPDTLLIGPDGRLAERVQGGAAWDSAAMRGRVLAVQRGGTGAAAARAGAARKAAAAPAALLPRVARQAAAGVPWPE